MPTTPHVNRAATVVAVVLRLYWTNVCAWLRDCTTSRLKSIIRKLLGEIIVPKKRYAEVWIA